MSQEWYLYKDGQQKGPYSREQLAQQAGAGAIGPADMVWTGGMSNWVKADQVEGLLPAAPAPFPPPAAPPPPAASPYQQGSGPFPGVSQYQHGSGPFPGPSAPGKQGKGLKVILAIILVGIIAIGGYFGYQAFFADGEGDSVTADPVTPRPDTPEAVDPKPDSQEPAAPGPVSPEADAPVSEPTDFETLMGEWKWLVPNDEVEGEYYGALYFGFYQDEELIIAVDDFEYEEDGFWYQTRYRFKDLDSLPQPHRDDARYYFGEEAKEFYYLYALNPSLEEWEVIEYLFRVFPSGAVMVFLDPGEEYELHRINRQELEAVLNKLEEIRY